MQVHQDFQQFTTDKMSLSQTDLTATSENFSYHHVVQNFVTNEYWLIQDFQQMTLGSAFQQTANFDFIPGLFNSLILPSLF